MKTILLTGATGFVGRQIYKALVKSSDHLVPVVRTGKESIYEGKPNIRRIVSSPDMFQESADWWAEQCRNIDCVIHAAWYTEPEKYLQSSQNMDCLIGSLNLAKGAAKAGVQRLVGVGTCFEYDLTPGVLSIDTPLKPLTPYAGAKAALYMGLTKWLHEQSVEFAWCRLFYLYGEGEDVRRLVPYLHKQLANGEIVNLTNGKQIRDFLEISEAGRLISEVALGNKQGPINICTGVPITVRQFAEQIADQYARRDLLKFGARPDNMIDPPCVLGIPNHGVTEKGL